MAKKQIWAFEQYENPRFVGESWDWWRTELEGKAERTRRNYIHDMEGFLNYVDWDTEKLYSVYMELKKAEDRREKKRLANKVAEYQKYLMTNREEIVNGKTKFKKAQKSSTVSNVPRAIISFFSANEETFKMNGNATHGISDEIPTINHEDFNLIIGVINSIRLKSALYILRDGGMRISDLCNMKIKDVQPLLESEAEFFTWEFKPEKTFKKSKVKANPVIGPEAIKWLKLWLKERNNRGITSEWIYTIITKRRDGREKGEKVNVRTFGQLFRNQRNKLGLQDTGVSIHSLRKMHTTQLGYGGVPSAWINRMQGRRGQGTQGTYTKPNPVELIEMFKRGYPTLSGTQVDNAEIDSLNKKIEELRKTIALQHGDEALSKIKEDILREIKKELGIH